MVQVIVVYDGNCSFCCWCASLLKRLDKLGRLKLVTADFAIASKLHRQLTVERCQRALQVISHDGCLLEGWDGLMVAIMQMPSLRWLGRLGAFPLLRNLGRSLYRFVASNRCKLSCKF